MPRKEPKPRKDATKTLSDKQIKKYIDGIHDGSITEEKLSEEVYFSIVKYLRAGLYEGFGIKYNDLLKLAAEDSGAYGTDLELLQELRENVYMFGAAKNYQMTKEISSLLIDDETGLRRTLEEFQDVARKTYDNWNDNWGETEYSTAIGQGYAAQKWLDIEKKADILPILKYSAIGDACEICMPFDSITAPVNDPIWNTIAPLNHFNCKCLLLQEEEGESLLTPDDEKAELLVHADDTMDDIFKSNAGKDGMVFNEDHPYFKDAKADLGKENFGMPIPDKD